MIYNRLILSDCTYNHTYR